LKEILKLDIRVAFYDALNWMLIASIFLKLESSLPQWGYYLVLIIPLAVMELNEVLNRCTTAASALKILLIYENVYVVFLGLIWFIVPEINVTYAFLMLLPSVLFHLLEVNASNKYKNLLNLHYMKRGPNVQNLLDKADSRGQLFGGLLGGLLGTTLGLDSIMIAFILGEVVSLYYGFKVYKLLEVYEKGI